MDCRRVTAPLRPVPSCPASSCPVLFRPATRLRVSRAQPCLTVICILGTTTCDSVSTADSVTVSTLHCRDCLRLRTPYCLRDYFPLFERLFSLITIFQITITYNTDTYNTPYHRFCNSLHYPVSPPPAIVLRYPVSPPPVTAIRYTVANIVSLRIWSCVLPGSWTDHLTSPAPRAPGMMFVSPLTDQCPCGPIDWKTAVSAAAPTASCAGVDRATARPFLHALMHYAQKRRG